MRLLGLLLW